MSSVPKPPAPAAPAPRPKNCALFNGILFSRKPCPEAAVTSCGRCGRAICRKHLRPQAAGRFLCADCDAYEDDDNWVYSHRGGGWRHRSSADADSRPVAAGAAAGAAAGTAAARTDDLTDEDRIALSTNADGAWQGDGAQEEADMAADDDSGGVDMDDGGFDAS